MLRNYSTPPDLQLKRIHADTARVSPFLKTGQLHAGSYVFVRSAEPFTDDWLLEVLGLNAYHPTDVLIHWQRHVVIGHSDSWTVIGDDFEWAKFHSPSAPQVLSRLVASVDEVFLCLLPDVDESFEFFYWSAGKLVRSYRKNSRDWGQAYTFDEHGEPLDSESVALPEDDDPATNRVWTIARSLGFDLDDSLGSYRVFAGPVDVPNRGGPFITNIPRDFIENPILGPHLSWRRE